MNLTTQYGVSKTNGNISHDDLLMLDSGSSQQSTISQPQKQQQQQQPLHRHQQQPSPFYLLNHFPLEQPPTGSTNLIMHWGLSRDFDKYVKHPIPPSLNDFLTDIPNVETAQHKAESFAGDAQNGVGTLRSLFADRVISKEILPLNEQQLLSFRLHREPILPELYQIFTLPREPRSTAVTTITTSTPITTTTTTTETGPSSSVSSAGTNLPVISPQVQRLIHDQPSRVSPDVKRKAPSDTPVGQQNVAPSIPAVGILGRLSGTPTLSTNASTSNSTSGHLNDDQDEMNLSKRKTKKTKKEKKP